MMLGLWYELLDELVRRKGLSRPQIERRSGVPAKTLASWLRGGVKRPRHWQPLARVLHALSATAEEAGYILRQAGGWDIIQLADQVGPEESGPLDYWLQGEALFQVPDRLVRTIVGRNEELQAANDALHNFRRCVLLGEAGVGKTTLAVEIAHRLRGYYRDGVFWANAALSSAEAVFDGWGQASGIDLRQFGDLQTRAARLRGAFARKQALIILDDVEHGEIAKLLMPGAHSETAVLFTTHSPEVAQKLARHRAGQVIALAPLSPDRSLRVLANVLGEERLVQEKASAERVADLLDGLPLALKIAAALCLAFGPSLALRNGLTLAQMADLLEEQQTRLSARNGGQGAAAVRLVFEQCWELLDDTLRAALATLAVFEGRPFSLASFSAIAQLDEEPDGLSLAQLIRLSLLNVHDRGRRRYRQNAQLALCASEKLADDAPAWSRFVSYYFDNARARLHSGIGLDGDWENVMAAMSVAHRTGSWARVLAFMALLDDEWRRLGMLAMARKGYALAQDAAEALQQPETSAAIALQWGRACLEQSDLAQARRHLNRALALYQELGDQQHIGDVELFLARVDIEEGDYDQAKAGLRTALRHYEGAEESRGMSSAQFQMALVSHLVGDDDGALEWAGEAMRRQIDVPDQPAVPGSQMLAVQAHMLAARAQMRKGSFDSAENHLQEAGALLEPLNEPASAAEWDYSYAAFFRRKGMHADARQHAFEALTQFIQLRDGEREIHAHLMIAGNEADWNEADSERRKVKVGLRQVERGIHLSELTDYQLGLAHLLHVKGKLLLQKGKTDEALATWQEALTVSLRLSREGVQSSEKESLSAAC